MSAWERFAHYPAAMAAEGKVTGARAPEPVPAPAERTAMSMVVDSAPTEEVD